MRTLGRQTRRVALMQKRAEMSRSRNTHYRDRFQKNLLAIGRKPTTHISAFFLGAALGSLQSGSKQASKSKRRIKGLIRMWAVRHATRFAKLTLDTKSASAQVSSNVQSDGLDRSKH